MISSMTGYGEAKGFKNNRKYTVELRSINHRFLDFQIRLPNKLNALEPEIKRAVQSKLSRGKVLVFVTIEKSNNLDSVYIDEKKINFYLSSLRKLGGKMKVSGDLSLKDLLSFPDIFQSNEAEVNTKQIWTELKPIMDKALKSLILAREKEGKTTFQDMDSRLKSITSFSAGIKKKAQGFSVRYKEKLQKQVKELTKGLTLEEDRLIKEVALMADRVDVTEELVRLQSHVELFHKTLRQGKEVGKKLDFVGQEMNREANTIASKCQDTQIAEKVVQIKAEIEKIKEQVQNVE